MEIHTWSTFSALPNSVLLIGFTYFGWVALHTMGMTSNFPNTCQKVPSPFKSNCISFPCNGKTSAIFLQTFLLPVLSVFSFQCSNYFHGTTSAVVPQFLKVFSCFYFHCFSFHVSSWKLSTAFSSSPLVFSSSALSFCGDGPSTLHFSFGIFYFWRLLLDSFTQFPSPY